MQIESCIFKIHKLKKNGECRHLSVFQLQRLLCWKLPISSCADEFQISVLSKLYTHVHTSEFLRTLLCKCSHDIKGIMDRRQAENDGC